MIHVQKRVIHRIIQARPEQLWRTLKHQIAEIDSKLVSCAIDTGLTEHSLQSK